MKLLSFGEVLWDVYPDNKYIGGAPFNFSAHFKRCGGDASLASCVGNDKLGEETVETVGKYGVGTEYISVSPAKPTGRCDVTLDENRVPSYNLIRDAAYDYIPTDNIGNGFDVLYFGTLALRDGFNRTSLKKLISRNSYREIFVDVNIRAPYYSEETVEFALGSATVLKISDEELPAVAQVLGITETDGKTFAEILKNKFENIRLIIITMGENGAAAFDCVSGRYFYCPAEKVDVVSTVGAGDSFGAAFLYNYLCGKDIEACLSAAAKLSGYVVAHRDAIPGQFNGSVS